jgi:asparagine synthase (glutamine-hydrolysing)
MCGLCGYVAPEGVAAPGRDVLERMTRTLAHRGPDAEGLRHDGRVGLGSRRLSIIDLPGGDQPISNEDGTIWIVYNGEVFNYRALREELAARGHRFRTVGDTEVVVHLYEEYGAECVRHLRGMFAFALWDAPRGRLLLARDRPGIKPLYYASCGGVLAFASELKSLLHILPSPPEPDPAALEEYLALGYVPAPRTILAGVRKLPPAHTLLWDRGRMDVRRYWGVRYDVDARCRPAEAVARLRALLEDAVRAWMVSDVPVGAFLSGGVDSSAVTALMCRVAPGRVQTFSIGFDDPTYDERAYARQVAARYDTDHYEVRLDAAALGALPRLAWSLDEPLADDSAVPTYVVSQLAHQHVKVVLSGDGGDELFGGYGWTYRDQTRRWVEHMPAPLRASLSRWAAGRAAAGGGSPGTRLLRGVRDATGTMEDGYLRRTTVDRAFRAALYHPALRARIDGYDGATPARALLALDGVKDARERMLRVDQHLYLPDDILFKVDRMSMAHSLEARTPLLDHPLMEFAATVPYGLKVRGWTSKYLLKRAVRDLVPAPLLRQRKQGFSMPVASWLRGPAGADVEAILLGRRATERALWRPEVVRRLLDEHRSGVRDLGRRLWSLLVLEVWARLYLDAQPGSAPPDTLHDMA